MARPTKMTGWWKELLEQRASGRVDLLATLCGVDVRSVRRWSQGTKLQGEHLTKLRKVAGKELLQTAPSHIRGNHG